MTDRARPAVASALSEASPVVPLPPSEARQAEGRELDVGGRVTAVAATTLRLADALAEIEVEPGVRAAVAVGDHAVWRGRVVGGRLTEARLCAHHPRPLPASEQSEARRLGERGVASRLVLRAAVCATVRSFFGARGYLEVDTPAMVPCPGLDVHLDAFALAGDAARPAFLATSPEYQMKRLLCGGLPRVFQLSHVFRRGEQGRWHDPEFLLLEFYRAFADLGWLMTETEALVRTVVSAHAPSLVVTVAGQRVDVARPFARLTVAEAFARHAGCPRAAMLALATSDEEQFFRLLVERVEPAIARYGVPVMLHDYPASQASLARRKPGDAELCERFELYLGELELCNGFAELTDPVEQRERLARDQTRRAARGLPVYPLDERFLAALAEGMPPAAGNALGLDRLVAVVAGADALADVIAFPAGWLA